MTHGSLSQKGNYFLSARVPLTVNGLLCELLRSVRASRKHSEGLNNIGQLARLTLAVFEGGWEKHFRISDINGVVILWWFFTDLQAVT